MNEFALKRTWGPVPAYPLVHSYKRKRKDNVYIAGSCSVESEEQVAKIALLAKMNGATHLRGGVFRAGTYPGKNFGWIKEDLIKAYYWAAVDNKLKNIIEVLDYRDLDKIDQYAMCYQVGCRQMQNYTLLREVGATKKPVFLKRNPAATIDEFLGAAEHILTAGCNELYLIERGSATNARHVRWDLSISMIPAIQQITELPILVDASHGTGRRDLVLPMTLAGIAAGANGLLVEFHENPQASLSDSEQAIGFEAFEKLMRSVKNLTIYLKGL